MSLTMMLFTATRHFKKFKNTWKFCERSDELWVLPDSQAPIIIEQLQVQRVHC